MSVMIEMEHINRIFPVPGGTFQALKDIDAQIDAGTFTILKGRSGSGKTTLLNIIGEFSMRLSGVKSPGERQERVEECLKMVGLGNRMTHMPAEMSGGEQQRVAIARAFAHRPRLILADEPTAELDSAMAAEITRIFREMTRKEGITVVMTTHDVGLMGAGDQIIELENGGRIYS